LAVCTSGLHNPDGSFLLSSRLLLALPPTFSSTLWSLSLFVQLSFLTVGALSLFGASALNSWLTRVVVFSSTVGMVDSLTTVTLYGALPTDDPIQPGASNARLVTPIGTASDGSETTYIEEVTIYGSGSSSTTQLTETPVSTWRGASFEGYFHAPIADVRKKTVQPPWLKERLHTQLRYRIQMIIEGLLSAVILTRKNAYGRNLKFSLRRYHLVQLQHLQVLQQRRHLVNSPTLIVP
jgi:hypothetical protein